jgi:hypothetical protein
MGPVDSSRVESGLDPAVHAFGRHLAAGAGALFALLSLLAETSVPTAVLRGGGALVCVLATYRAGTWALERALALEAAPGRSAEDQDEEAPQR